VFADVSQRVVSRVCHADSVMVPVAQPPSYAVLKLRPSGGVRARGESAVTV